MALQPFLDAPTQNEPYKLIDILPMAYPKGQAPVCEMTGLPAKVKCETEHITYTTTTGRRPRSPGTASCVK